MPGKFEACYGTAKLAEHLYANLECADKEVSTDFDDGGNETYWLFLISPLTKHPAVLCEDSQGFVTIDTYNNDPEAEHSFASIEKNILEEEGREWNDD